MTCELRCDPVYEHVVTDVPYPPAPRCIAARALRGGPAQSAVRATPLECGGAKVVGLSLGIVVSCARRRIKSCGNALVFFNADA